MKKNLYPTVIFLSLCVFLLIACAGGQSTQATGSGSGAQPLIPTPPPEYAGKTNPFAGNTSVVAEGQTLYTANCVACHGETGRGDGSASAALEPRPADLAARLASLEDAYLLFRISEGGAMAPFNSQMPNWKSLLDEEKIWKIITYIRTLQE